MMAAITTSTNTTNSESSKEYKSPTNMINTTVSVTKTTALNTNENNDIKLNAANKTDQTKILLSPSTEKDFDGLVSNGMPLQSNLHRIIKNKLKRKKKISSSLISVNGDERHTINEKKRSKVDKQSNKENFYEDCEIVVVTKPPLPPKTFEKQNVKIPPPRLKRKMEENSATIQKLNAQSEQLRLENTELKTSLNNERNAVRTLRAQTDSEIRKLKTEMKKLQTALEVTKKTATANNKQKIKIFKDDTNPASKDHLSGDLNKLNLEISSLKDANRILEEKIRICNEGDRRKSQYIQQITDSYETRLTQISKSAKNEISRLLEEIKTKERNIGQLRKEINANQNNLIANTTTSNQNKRNIRKAQHPSEMKKLKDIEANIENTNCVQNNDDENEELQTSFKLTTTSCNNEHEMNNRIFEAHRELRIYRAKDTMNSDSDSAVSSAPQSISPQPSTGQDANEIWQTVKNYTKELENLKAENLSIQNENEFLKNELKLAKIEIDEYEKTAIEANKTNLKLQQLKDRIIYLEDKERELMKETHELREQNELMEFRILELEESNALTASSQSSLTKWSLRSNTTPDTKEMWTDTEKEPDELLLYTDRSDSGVTSPHSQNNVDDRNIISPCDLSISDPVPTDELKRRINLLSKRQNLDEEDKLCLMQVINLINNLDALSNDSVASSSSSGDDSFNFELIKSKFSDYNNFQILTPSSSAILPHQQQQQQQHQQQRSILPISEKFPQNNNNNSNRNNSRIVATVLPYSSSLSSTPTDSPSRKYRSWTTTSLQESGIFDGDNISTSTSNIELNYHCQSTQTLTEDFPCYENPSTNDLCAEIQKLNKFREEIEECVTKSSSTTSAVGKNHISNKVVPILSPNLSEQKRLQFYKDRLEILEKKLIVYESSGDVQEKRLAERLQREIQLESLVKDLRERVEQYEINNLKLEEEKCEFEEAENDTRLRLQRLEIDLEIYSQRNNELEMSRDALQCKLKDTKNHCNLLQNEINDNKKKMQTLQDESKDVTNRINMIKTSMPALLLFHSLMVNGSLSNDETANICKCTKTVEYECEDVDDDDDDNDNDDDDDDDGDNIEGNDDTCSSQYSNMNNDKINKEDDRNCVINSPQLLDQITKCTCGGLPYEPSLRDELLKFQNREKELNKNINELNRAYQETMENADCLWAQIEKDYKIKLDRAEATEYALKLKICQLEKRLQNDSQSAQERICTLEENETDLSARFFKLNKDHRDLLKTYTEMNEEHQTIKDEYEKMKKFLDGPSKESMDLEKCRSKNLQEELNCLTELLNETQKKNTEETDSLRNQLANTMKELLQIKVTNSELVEEVCTLEKEIQDLHGQKNEDNDKIRCLSDEIRTKDEIISKLEKKVHGLETGRIPRKLSGCIQPAQSLAQEMTTSSPKRIRIENVNDLKSASKQLSDAMAYLNECNVCQSDVELASLANEVKGIAECILGENTTTTEILIRIEEQITQSLLEQRSKSMKSKCYCSVYCPISR